MLTVIVNANVFAPEPRGRCRVLVAGERVVAIADNIDIRGSDLQVVDALGRWLVPGFVDALTHPCGGGGEGGFGNRTAEVPAEAFIQAGVTTPVGALGTDSIGRSLEVLYATVMSLRARGLAALMYTGSYRVPAPTLTGDIARDLTLVEPVIGVGELAVSDHRSSQPARDELRRIAADAALGGTLAGRGGRVLVHVGDGDRRLAPLREALEGSDLPVHSFYPTHINRSDELLAEAVAFTRAGGYADITVSTTPELVAAGDLPALEALARASTAGAPADRLTLSSDAGGSLPVYVDGRLQGLSAAGPGCLLELLQEAIRERPAMVPLVIAALTANPAAALALPDRGRLQPGARADLLLLEPDTGALAAVMCGGRWLAGPPLAVPGLARC
jgi:beta-aspartyl-dipeptidase (metallo-type)